MKRLLRYIAIGVVSLFTFTGCVQQAPVLETAVPPTSTATQPSEDLVIISEGFVASGFGGYSYWFEVENISKETAYAANFDYDVYGDGDAIYSLNNTVWDVKILPQQKLKILGMAMLDPGTGVTPVRAEVEFSARSRPVRGTETGILEVSEINLNIGEYGSLTIDGRVLNNSDNSISRWEAIAWCSDAAGNLVFATSYQAYEETIEVGAEAPYQIQSYAPEGVQLSACTGTALTFIS